MTAIKIKDVTYRYPRAKQNVIQNLTCSFEYGKFYVIAGSSGSGKTTILSLLAGIYQPLSGTIFYENEDIRKMDGAIYRRDCVSTIYQKLNLIPYLTASENIELCLDLKGFQGDKQRYIADLLQKVQLDSSLKDRYPAKLSGGECQRVAIARCLASDSKVILADEPTGNLDADNANAIVKLFQNIAHEQNKCVIMVSHDISIMDSVDELLRMKDGNFISK